MLSPLFECNPDLARTLACGGDTQTSKSFRNGNRTSAVIHHAFCHMGDCICYLDLARTTVSGGEQMATKSFLYWKRTPFIIITQFVTWEIACILT
jgi:hypothetical protein